MFLTVVYICLGIAVTDCDQNTAAQAARSIEPVQTLEDCHVQGLNFVDLSRSVMEADENRAFVFRIMCESFEDE